MPTKLLLLITLICACGQSARGRDINLPESAAALSAPLDAAPRRGTLYRVSHAGRISYLFGTIHVGKQGFFPLEPEVTRALAASSALVIELDIRDEAPFQLALDKHGIYPAGQTIVEHLSPDTLDRLLLALAQAGLSLHTVERYKPWLVANLLVGVELEHHGFERSRAVEYFLLDAAEKQDKAVRELESADYQLALFDTMDDAQQESYLRENLKDLDNGDSLKKSEDLISAWSSADPPRIAAVLRELTSGDTVSAAFMQNMLLGKRNPEMASSIERIMQRDQVAFVGVGLLHLVGEQGLPQLLRQRGYEVEKLY
ncbi:TraB/GumN family protein [Rugamonas sp.]|uniref:TraB/GumN family protein n=1 Tax=Rugamonas sp. TaxID=1926287 RepID=UPI0025FEFFCD|nr:TraB/GumN family protein [Rugamonas sp.]